MQVYAMALVPVASSHGLCGSLQGRVSWGSPMGSRSWQAIVTMKLGAVLTKPLAASQTSPLPAWAERSLNPVSGHQQSLNSARPGIRPSSTGTATHPQARGVEGGKQVGVGCPHEQWEGCIAGILPPSPSCEHTSCLLQTGPLAPTGSETQSHRAGQAPVPMLSL